MSLLLSCCPGLTSLTLDLCCFPRSGQLSRDFPDSGQVARDWQPGHQSPLAALRLLGSVPGHVLTLLLASCTHLRVLEVSRPNQEVLMKAVTGGKYLGCNPKDLTGLVQASCLSWRSLPVVAPPLSWAWRLSGPSSNTALISRLSGEEKTNILESPQP